MIDTSLLSADTADWKVAEQCKDILGNCFAAGKKKLPQRRIPQLVTAVLGGTGTGKSTLLNALLRQQVVAEGRERPTTHEPILICSCAADVSAFAGFQVCRIDHPLLDNLILLDCPDPDTTEQNNFQNHFQNNFQNNNLTMLRQALPYCDVLLVTATQQKYRSKIVLDELADAAAGARLIFVQTHADKDIDIRQDWKDLLQERYETGQMYFVNSRNENADLTALRQLLTQDLTGEIAYRIRQANAYSLTEEAVSQCQRIAAAGLKPVNVLCEKMIVQRRQFGERFFGKILNDITRDRSIWEQKILSKISVRWGTSPFSLLLRLYQSTGAMLSGVLLTRVRSPIQLAVWGTFEGVRQLRKRKHRKKPLVPPLSIDDRNQLKESALVLTGFADDAQMSAVHCQSETVLRESEQMYEAVLPEIAAELDSLTSVLAEKHSKFRIRCPYEVLWSAMLVFLSARLAKNFFIDSFWYNEPLFGINYYCISLAWLAAWAAGLIVMFTFTLRKGMVQENALDWSRLPALDNLFALLEKDTVKIKAFCKNLNEFKEQLDVLKSAADTIDRRLGYVR